MEANITEFNHSDYSHYDDTTEEIFSDPDKYVRELWNLILLTYGDQCVISVMKASQIRPTFFRFVKQFTRILNETYDRFTLELSLYDKEKDSLMNRLKQISTSQSSGTNKHKVNDTPQNYGNNASDEYQTDYYLSNFEKTEDEASVTTESEADPTTIMSRLNEISSLYRDLMRDWSLEFRVLFWPHG